MRHVEAYSRLAGVYDEIVIDPCHDRWASFLHELWSADPDGVRPSSISAAAQASSRAS